MTALDHKPREIEPELYAALGRVVVRWSSLETILTEFLAHLLEANPAYLQVIKQSESAESQHRWITTLCEMRFKSEDTAGRLTQLLRNIESARADRNAWVDGVWSSLCPDGAVLVRTTRLNRPEIVVDELVTLADFNELGGRVQELILELSYLGKKVGFLPS